MKLNDFLAKPTKPRSRTTRTISFVNETKETELNNQIELHLDRLNTVDKWYKKQWVGVTGGFIGTIILINTINYTLPD